ncbi:MAG: hypothetical protein ACRC7P_10100, partial [Enterovibrio sp.]
MQPAQNPSANGTVQTQGATGGEPPEQQGALNITGARNVAEENPSTLGNHNHSIDEGDRPRSESNSNESNAQHTKTLPSKDGQATHLLKGLTISQHRPAKHPHAQQQQK